MLFHEWGRDILGAYCVCGKFRYTTVSELVLYFKTAKAINFDKRQSLFPPCKDSLALKE